MFQVEIKFYSSAVESKIHQIRQNVIHVENASVPVVEHNTNHQQLVTVEVHPQPPSSPIQAEPIPEQMSPQASFAEVPAQISPHEVPEQPVPRTSGPSQHESIETGKKRSDMIRYQYITMMINKCACSKPCTI